MPIECKLLKDQPEPMAICPNCHYPFRSFFMRGTVQSGWRKLFGLPYCCVICGECKKVVGYEKPDKE